MQFTPSQLKDKLLKCLDAENNVLDMAGCLEVVSVLENYPITREALEQTRIGKHVNELRKKTSNDQLAKRAKKLVRSWQKLISTPSDKLLVNGEQSSISPALSQQSSRLWSKPNSPAGLVRKPESPALNKSSHEKPITPKSGHIHAKPNTPSLPPSHIQQKRLFPSQESVSSPRLQSNHPGVVAGNISHKSVISPKGSSRPSTPVSVTNRSGISSPSLVHSRPQTPVNFNGSGNHSQTPVSQSNTGVPDIVNRLPRNSSQENLKHLSQNSELPEHKSDHSSVNSSRKNKSDQKYSSKSRKRPSEDMHMTVIAPKLKLMTGKDCKGVMNGSVCSASVKDKYAERKRTKASNANSESSLGFCTKKNVNLALKTDLDKDRIPAVVSKTPKVKTTAQLIAELQAKSGSDTVGKSVIHQIETNQIVKEVDTPQSVVPAGAKPRARKKTNAEESPENLKPPSTPISWTQTKNDLVERYLQTSVSASLPEDISPFKDENCKVKLDNSSCDVQDSGVDIGDSLVPDVVSTMCASELTEQKSDVSVDKGAKPLSLAEIYNMLPPLDLDNFEFDEGTYEVTEPREISDSDVERIESENWTGVNGCYDNDEQWHHWTELFSIQAYNGDSINILPYVVTD